MTSEHGTATRPPREGTLAIEADGLVKTYAGGIRALDGVGFEVEAGTIFGLLGPNGAGKSTTVKILTTLSRPDGGTARVAGLDVVRDAPRVRRAIGVVAQRSGVDPMGTGRENLELQGQLHGLSGRAARQRATELLERFGLTEAAGRVARTYSGGMQRRLDIAMGLMHRPQVLFLDEPTTGLDPEIRVGLWEEIRHLAREEGLTILLTTHYLDEADRLAGRLAILDRGRIVAAGEPEQLKSELHGDAIHVGLEEPAPEAAVRAALARAGMDDVGLDGSTVRARTSDGAASLPRVLAALEGEGLAVASAAISRPSLDDVYLRYTGHAFATDGKEAA